jgi:hypothetical protein
MAASLSIRCIRPFAQRFSRKIHARQPCEFGPTVRSARGCSRRMRSAPQGAWLAALARCPAEGLIAFPFDDINAERALFPHAETRPDCRHSTTVDQEKYDTCRPNIAALRSNPSRCGEILAEKYAVVDRRQEIDDWLTNSKRAFTTAPWPSWRRHPRPSRPSPDGTRATDRRVRPTSRASLNSRLISSISNSKSSATGDRIVTRPMTRLRDGRPYGRRLATNRHGPDLPSTCRGAEASGNGKKTSSCACVARPLRESHALDLSRRFQPTRGKFS